MQAIILAGGFGTRLGPLVQDLPKPLLPMANRPFLQWLLDFLEEQGVTQAALCVHHHHQRFEEALGKRHGKISLAYHVEPAPLGTGGALRQALRELDPQERVIALNGDSLVRLDYRQALARHEESAARMTLAACRMDDCSRFGQLELRQGMVTGFRPQGSGSGIVSTGWYILEPDIFDGFDLPESFSFEHDFLRPYVPLLQPSAYGEVEYFIDIGVPEDYVRACEEIPQAAGAACAA